MDIFNEDIKNLWASLNNENVRYIMIGGFATNLHGFQRTTGDLDILIDDTPDNRKKLRFAFYKYGLGDFEPIESMQFVPGWTSFYLNNGFEIDLMTLPLKGLENISFSECYQSASIAEIYDLKIPFLHINHLIANKRATNRPKDQIDVLELERIKKIIEEE